MISTVKLIFVVRCANAPGFGQGIRRILDETTAKFSDKTVTTLLVAKSNQNPTNLCLKAFVQLFIRTRLFGSPKMFTMIVS